MKLPFELEICVKGAIINDHVFEKGELYPVLGHNNGTQIVYTENKKYGGDAKVLLCHNFGGVDAPVDDSVCEEFGAQDGTIPPLFMSVYKVSPPKLKASVNGAIPLEWLYAHEMKVSELPVVMKIIDEWCKENERIH